MEQRNRAEARGEASEQLHCNSARLVRCHSADSPALQNSSSTCSRGRRGRRCEAAQQQSAHFRNQRVMSGAPPYGGQYGGGQYGGGQYGGQPPYQPPQQQYGQYGGQPPYQPQASQYGQAPPYAPQYGAPASYGSAPAQHYGGSGAPPYAPHYAPPGGAAIPIAHPPAGYPPVVHPPQPHAPPALPAEKRAAAQRAFAMYDKDRSGHIDSREFFEALRYLGLGISWEDALAVFAIVDTNGNGHVTMDEFTEHYAANY
eukprot:m.73701 g.73701  ORF g.73701 m.73701 type:complete len:257 (-) comp8038_c0_seq2:88-858(-)